MTSRELHAWVEKQGVPAKWQLPVVQLLRGLLEEEREWPTIPAIGCRGPLVFHSFVAMWWRDMTVNLFDDGAVKMFVRSDCGPGAQGIPLGSDWVREVVRLAPKKRPASECTGHYGPNEKPAPEVVGGIQSGPSIQRHRIRVTCDLSKLGVEQAIVDLYELGDKPVLLVVGEVDACSWSWIYEKRDYLAHHGIDTTKCYRSSELDMDEWILRGEKHEIYSEGT